MNNEDATTQNTAMYDINLNKPLEIAFEGELQQGEVSNVSVSSIGTGAVQNVWKFGPNGAIEMYDSAGNLAIYIGFENV